MNKSAINFFDDIIRTLSIEAESAKFANLSPEVLNEFYSVTAPPPVQPVVQPPTPAVKAPQYQTPNVEPAVPETSAPQVQKTAAVNYADDSAIISQMDMTALQKSASICKKCNLCNERKSVVFGAGKPDADLMFIGESPGADEDAQGIPFVGEAGQLLTRMINAMQFTRSDVYITNIVKCHPPKNRDPEDSEAETCFPYLQRQIELVQPKVIVVLGAVPLQYLLNQRGITRLRGNWMEYNGIQTMPTFHPAYLLRNPEVKKDVWMDLQKVMQVFGKNPAPVKKRIGT